MNLFEDSAEPTGQPLAARMRPRTLEEYIGQEHIIGPGRLLRRAIQADQLSSVIFYGPPGTGKTTLARVIANHTKTSFLTLNAVLSGVQQIREAIKKASELRSLYDKRTTLFVDEVHRWNRAQQDALLPWVENGTFILIGATTENPFFEVNRALVSRSRVFQLLPLQASHLESVARAALSDPERGYGRWKIEFEQGTLEHLVDTAAGDARSLLNALELAVETGVDSWPPPPGTKICIDRETAEQSIQKRVVLYDRDGDYHYDVISAFIKSLRGSDPDAAMYWLARMVAAGEDAGFIFRRMLISACEDIGLADPAAVGIVESCAAAFDRIGMPEGRYHLAHAALYLATAPKSNSSTGFFDALAAVEAEHGEVPSHLKDASRDGAEFGHGKGYQYPHAWREHWVAQQYLPGNLVGKIFYTPGTQGHEGKIRDEILARRELQLAALLESDGTCSTSGEALTFTPKKCIKDSWMDRTEAGSAQEMLQMRELLLERASTERYHRILVYPADNGLVLHEAYRRVPEGLVLGLCTTPQARQLLSGYMATLDELSRPVLAHGDSTDFTPPLDDSSIRFDRVILADPAADPESIARRLEALMPLCAPDGLVVLTCRIPARGMRLSGLVQTENNAHAETPDAQTELVAAWRQAEEEFYSGVSGNKRIWDENALEKALAPHFGEFDLQCQPAIFPRRLDKTDIERWLDPAESPYGAYLAMRLAAQEIRGIHGLLSPLAGTQTVQWKTVRAFIRASGWTSNSAK